MVDIKCPFDTCLYNIDNECQRLEVQLITVEVYGVELLDCESYERGNIEDI